MIVEKKRVIEFANIYYVKEFEGKLIIKQLCPKTGGTKWFPVENITPDEIRHDWKPNGGTQIGSVSCVNCDAWTMSLYRDPPVFGCPSSKVK